MPCNNSRGVNPQREQALSRYNCGTPERVCIQAKRVFDACISQFVQENETLTVSFPVQPLKFVGAQSTVPSIVSNVLITPEPGSTCSRVQFCVTVPIQVVATDSCGNSVVGSTSVTFTKDLLMKVPKEGVVPVGVECTANIAGVNGKIRGCKVSLTLCVTLITKVVADVELLVHSLGYPALPECQEYTEDVCSGHFNTPIYPR
ncbi:MAG: hypothetical protein WC292_04005 [Clostridia bacterium]